ncbi:LysR family transcriptional regulator [Leucothrix arctica]|nr:LysR family transcriptional regulator [Leucothrix arctica]
MKHLTTCNLLKELRAFCVTRQEGSMSKASEVLYASQPTISLQIKTLEQELEVKLFERRGPKLKLTTEGEILYDLVSPLVQGIDHIKESFAAHYGDLTTGELTIAAEESTILYTLPEPVRRFVEEHPGIRLRLANVTGRDGRDMLLADEVDFAVSSMLDVPENLDYTPFVSYPPVLITPKGHPLAKLDKVTLADIGEYGMILPPSHFSSWRLVKMVFALNGTSYRVVLEAGGWEVVKRYVDIGLGISIVTDICITDADRERFEIVNLDEYFPARKYGIVARTGKLLSAPAQKFIDILNECYTQKP